MAATLGTVAGAYGTPGYPVVSSLSMDAGGADALLVILYCNSTPATSPAPTFGGTALTALTTHPNAAAAGQGWMGVYGMLSPGSGAKTLSSGSFQGAERFLLGIPVSGVDVSGGVAGILKASGFGDASGANPWNHASLTGLSAGDLAVDIAVHYYNSNVDTLSAPSGTTVLVDNNTNSPVQFRSRSAIVSGSSIQFTWASTNAFNAQTGYTAVFKPGATGPVTPTVNVVSSSRAKISRVGTNVSGGKDQTDVVFSVNQDFQAYQVRLVASSAAAVTDGTLLESGSGGTANVNQTITVTDDELVAAGAAEGSNLLKIFAQLTDGTWTT